MRKTRRFLLLVVVLVPCILLKRSEAQGDCDIDEDCRAGQCCSTYGYCGSGPDYCRPGCILDDIEILGGDLPDVGGGFFVDRDDSCAKECEDNPRCQYWTFSNNEQLCYLKNARPTLRQAERGSFISGSTRDDGCVLVPEEPTPPQCLPPKQIINGKCQFKATTFRPFFTTSTTTPAPPTATVPRPEGLPTPTYPKKIEPLPTLPPKIAEKTFINPPLITNTFSRAFDYCNNLGGILPSFDFFDVVNIGERPRTSGTSNSTVNTDEGTSVERNTFIYDEEPEEYENYEEEVEQEVPEYNEIDTGIIVVNQKGEERKLLRGKRQLIPSISPWYWINNYNDGRTCYAALPGDVVKFRAFSCNNLLRVICQRSKTDRTWLQTQVRKVEKQVEEDPGSLENQVPESIIRANPQKPLFKLNGLTNPYLNYHAKQMKRRQQVQQIRQQQLALAPFLNLRLYLGFPTTI